MTALYHYTCSCCRAGIARSRQLRIGMSFAQYDRAMLRNGLPTSGLSPIPGIVWLTDLENPNRDALGLSSTYLQCDRTEWRVTVERLPAIETWGEFKRDTKPNAEWIALVEEYSKPERWFVSRVPVPVLEIDRAPGANRGGGTL